MQRQGLLVALFVEIKEVVLVDLLAAKLATTIDQEPPHATITTRDDIPVIALHLLNGPPLFLDVTQQALLRMNKTRRLS